MYPPLIIIGSGFAAYQLIKTLRRKNSDMPIQLFTADNGDEYNKPDLSHVFTRQQRASDLITMTGKAFATQQKIEIFANTRVDKIDTDNHTITANGICYHYSRLVLATGAKTFIPILTGDATAEVITLNSLEEYRVFEQRVTQAQRILIMGGGLIGTELAMDLCSAGKKVQILDPSPHLMASMIPDFVATALEQQLRNDGVQIDCLDHVISVEYDQSCLVATTRNGLRYKTDCIISAAGLVPNTELAKKAGLTVQRGIVVDKTLRTSVDNIYALGDCAEINGKVMACMQPIVLSANVLASQLLSSTGELSLPAMMTKVKTPRYPIQSGGNCDSAASWQVNINEHGILARAYNHSQHLTGFVVTKDNISQAFPLLRELQAAN